MGVAERRKREKQAREESIKKAARQLFVEKGFTRTTMEEVAEQSELAVGTIYNFFKSKEELYFSILEPLLQENSEKLSHITDNHRKRPDKVLEELADFMVETYTENPEAYRPLAYYRAEQIGETFSEEKMERIKELMSRNDQRVASVIARGIDEGIFKPVNPRAVSKIIWSVMMGVFQSEDNRAYSGATSYLKPTLRVAMDLILGGLQGCGD